MQAALEALLAELVLGPELACRDANALVAWLEERGIDPADARAIAEDELPGLLTYRELVRQTLRGALERSIPRSLARGGAAFERYFARFLAERGPRTNYLRDVTRELIEFVAASEAKDLPPYWLDLARHEALHIEVAATPTRADAPHEAALELDAGLAFAESVRLHDYDYAVHTLPEDVDDRSVPAHERTHILAYRDADHDVRYLALSDFAASLLQRLFDGNSLAESLRGAASQKGVSLDATILDACAELLAELARRGVLLGPCAIGSVHGGDPATLGPTPSATPPPNPQK